MNEESSVFRWGILGPGKIARRFAEGLAHCSSAARVTAVGSRSLERAREFGDEFGASRAYGSYEELAADGSLDAVYIATPHSEHARHAILCLEHGRPVLVEKPFTLNQREARQVIDMARARGLFCMEAMWTRFFPAVRLLRRLIADGAIGRPRMVTADFGYRTEFDAGSRLFDPRLGGGGLLDVGIYPLSLACMLLGEPVSAVAQASLAATQVDDSAAFLLQHRGGELSLLSCATQVRTANEARVFGEAGSISLNGEWWKADGLTISRDGADAETVRLEYPGNGFQFEADETQACIRSGKLESAIMPLDETMMQMRVLDDLRRQTGVVYPADAQ